MRQPRNRDKRAADETKGAGADAREPDQGDDRRQLGVEQEDPGGRVEEGEGRQNEQ